MPDERKGWNHDLQGRLSVYTYVSRSHNWVRRCCMDILRRLAGLAAGSSDISGLRVLNWGHYSITFLPTEQSKLTHNESRFYLRTHVK